MTRRQQPEYTRMISMNERPGSTAESADVLGQPDECVHGTTTYHNVNQSLSRAGAPTQTGKQSIADMYLVTLNPDIDFKSHMDWVHEQLRQPSNAMFQYEIVVNMRAIINGYQAKLSTSTYENLSKCDQVKPIIKEQLAELDD